MTTFASNVARLRSAAEAGFAAGRQVCILGRAMERVVGVARELGMLDGVPQFLGMDAFDRLPRDKILALATGSQGEPRAALARMSEGEHPTAELSRGDTVIFSSRTIPGNEKAVGRIINAFSAGGVEVITDRHALVHVSGHPRRAEVTKMYGWLRPQMAVPAHGEALHLTEHLALRQGARRSSGASRDEWRSRPLRARRTCDDRQDRPRPAAQGRRHPAARRAGMRGAAPPPVVLRGRVDRHRADPEGRDGGRPGRDDLRPARALPRRRGLRRRSSTPPSSRPSRACRAASGATRTSCRPPSSAASAPRSPPSGARSRRFTRSSLRFNAAGRREATGSGMSRLRAPSP